MSHTIRARLVLLSLGWLLPILVLASVGASLSHRARSEAERTANLELARAVAASFSAYVEGVVEESALLADGITGGLAFEQVRRLLKTAAERRPSVRSFSWVSAEGIVVASSNDHAVGFDLRDRDYVQAIQRGAPWAIGDLAAAKADGKPIIGIGHEVRGLDGSYAGCVVVVVEPHLLDVRGLRLLQPKDARYSIFDRSGNLVYRSPPAPAGRYARDEAEETMLRRALAGQDAMATYTSPEEGDARTGAAVPIPPLGWAARASRSEAKLVESLRREAGIQGAVTLFVALLVLGASLTVGRWIVGPLAKLEDDAGRWLRGERTPGATPLGPAPAEIEALSRAFDEMARGLVAQRELEQAERERLEAVTEQLRQSEEQLRRAVDELKAADQHKDEFLAVLSHELRNPLAPIKNALTILDRVAPESARATHARQVLERQVVHITRLVDDLLDVSRIARGKLQVQRSRIDLATIVRRAAEDHRSLVERQGLALEVSIRTEPIPLDGDSVRLTQVIGNLLQNAAKFTPPGGRVHLDVVVEGGEAVVSVEDTGIGFEPGTEERLFEPFAQGRQGIERRQGGLGLGLALVKGLVERHGGRVRAVSEGADRGARFELRLPISAAANISHEARSSSPAATRRVLVIEDNVDGADSLREILELEGHVVDVAYDGPSGLEKARSIHPEVVLCDLGLPGLDGYGVARALRQEPWARDRRLVALTGYAQPEDRRRTAEAGFDLHLSKPPSIDDLRLAVGAP